MRVYYASDLHGAEKLWRKFLNAAAFYDADVLVMGGDLTGKVLVPVVERRPGRWAARLSGKEQKAKTEGQLVELEQRIRFNGFYPIRCSLEEFSLLSADESFRDQRFKKAMRAELQRWLQLAHDKLAGSGVTCFVMPGNDDEWDIDAVLESAPVPIVSCEGRVVEIDGMADGVQMLSSAWTNPTPWDSPRELPEDELAERLEKLAAELTSDRPAIFNLHCPPYDSGLDRAPQLTDDLRVVTEGGEPKMVPVGSTAVRELIERHQPLLALHGHIHESRAAVEIGRTLCVNPGSAYAEGVLDGVVVELDRDGISSYQLVSG